MNGAYGTCANCGNYHGGLTCPSLLAAMLATPTPVLPEEYVCAVCGARYSPSAGAPRGSCHPGISPPRSQPGRANQRRRRFLCVGLALLSSLGFLLLLGKVYGAETCKGVERWDVKTLSDPAAKAVPLDEAPTQTTVTQLASRQAPEPPVAGHEPRGVGREEWQLYTVEAFVKFAKKEADQDAHIVLGDLRQFDGHTMIVESADPRCAAGSVALPQITAARAALLKAIRSRTLTTKTLRRLVRKHVRVTGVGFYDKLHGQTGVAPNGIELRLVGFELIP